jgi:hypothetical protein
MGTTLFSVPKHVSGFMVGYKIIRTSTISEVSLICSKSSLSSFVAILLNFSVGNTVKPTVDKKKMKTKRTINVFFIGFLL